MDIKPSLQFRKSICILFYQSDVFKVYKARDDADHVIFALTFMQQHFDNYTVLRPVRMPGGDTGQDGGANGAGGPWLDAVLGFGPNCSPDTDVGV